MTTPPWDMSAAPRAAIDASSADDPAPPPASINDAHTANGNARA